MRAKHRFRAFLFSMMCLFLCSINVASVLKQTSLPHWSQTGRSASGAIDFRHASALFVQNLGQLDTEALFYAQTSRYRLWLTRKGLVFDIVTRPKVKQQLSVIRGLGPDLEKDNESIRDVCRLNFVNSNEACEVLPLDTSGPKFNFFLGPDRTKWRSGVSASSAVLYKELYPKIDMKVYSHDHRLEYDFIVKPGGNPRDILFSYDRVKSSAIDAEGNLQIETEFGRLVQAEPVCYQHIDGQRRPVKAAFQKHDENTYAFRLDDYDKNENLVIDPLIIDYSTYLGGTDNEIAYHVAVDRFGCAYITGKTHSLDFPTRNAFMPDSQKIWRLSNAFVTKLSPDGSTILYSTYLGGESYDEAFGIAVDPHAQAVIVGETCSDDFPVQSPVQKKRLGKAGIADAFVAKLSADGSSLIYSTYLGGNQTDYAKAVAVDRQGCAYVTGWTLSTNFPVMNALQKNLSDKDAFVTKLSPDGASILYSTYLGSAGVDKSEDIAVDAEGAAYITGGTWPDGRFPIKNGFQKDYGGGVYDAFVTKLAPAGNSLVYSTYLGGEEWDIAYGIALDQKGCAYVTGRTGSQVFPLKNPYQSKHAGGGDDAFIAKISNDGRSLIYATYLGGKKWDVAYGIAADHHGAAYVVGRTFSSDFPCRNPYRAKNAQGYDDAFVTKFAPDGQSLSYSTYFGGGYMDCAYSVDVDSTGAAYLAGYTWSSDFPLERKVQGHLSKTQDGFVAKLINLEGSSMSVAVQNSESDFLRDDKERSEDIALPMPPSPRSPNFSSAGGTFVPNHLKAPLLHQTNSNRPLRFSYQKERLTWDAKKSFSGSPYDVCASDGDAGDLDNDGDVDLVISGLTVEGQRHGASSFPSNELVLLINDGHGYFHDESRQRLKSGPFYGTTFASKKLADIDGDGDLDILLVGQENEYSGSEFLPGWQDKVLVNDGHGNFWEQTSVRLPIEENSFTYGVDFGDIDRDGDLDIFLPRIGSEGPPARHSELWLNSGRGRFSRLATFHNLDWNGIKQSSFGDFNNDGFPDIVAPNGDKLFLLINTRNRGFETSLLYPALRTNLALHHAIVADFNRDGLQDIFVANQDLNGQDILFINIGDNRFVDRSTNMKRKGAALSVFATCGDIDLDGDVDIFVGNGSDAIPRSLSVFYENTGWGKFCDSTEKIPDLTSGTQVLLADFDGDSDLDIALISGGICKILINELIQ